MNNNISSSNYTIIEPVQGQFRTLRWSKLFISWVWVCICWNVKKASDSVLFDWKNGPIACCKSSNFIEKFTSWSSYDPEKGVIYYFIEDRNWYCPSSILLCYGLQYLPVSFTCVSARRHIDNHREDELFNGAIRSYIWQKRILCKRPITIPLT